MKEHFWFWIQNDEWTRRKNTKKYWFGWRSWTIEETLKKEQGDQIAEWMKTRPLCIFISFIFQSLAW